MDNSRLLCLRFRPVSLAFGERSKQRRMFAQKLRVFDREERSPRSTAGPKHSLRFQEFPKSPSSLEKSEAVVDRVVSLIANLEADRPTHPL